MSLDRLCFLIVEREKTNALRLRHLHRYYRANKKLDFVLKTQRHRLKQADRENLYKQITLHHSNYRRVSNLMNAQRKILFELRKETGATPKYNTRNYCTHIELDGYSLTMQQIRARHASYVFDTIVLKEKTSVNNPYAQELYGSQESSI